VLAVEDEPPPQPPSASAAASAHATPRRRLLLALVRALALMIVPPRAVRLRRARSAPPTAGVDYCLKCQISVGLCMQVSSTTAARSCSLMAIRHLPDSTSLISPAGVTLKRWFLP